MFEHVHVVRVNNKHFPWYSHFASRALPLFRWETEIKKASGESQQSFRKLFAAFAKGMFLSNLSFSLKFMSSFGAVKLQSWCAMITDRWRVDVKRKTIRGVFNFEFPLAIRVSPAFLRGEFHPCIHRPLLPSPLLLQDRLTEELHLLRIRTNHPVVRPRILHPLNFPLLHQFKKEVFLNFHLHHFLLLLPRRKTTLRKKIKKWRKRGKDSISINALEIHSKQIISGKPDGLKSKRTIQTRPS